MPKKIISNTKSFSKKKSKSGKRKSFSKKQMKKMKGNGYRRKVLIKQRGGSNMNEANMTEAKKDELTTIITKIKEKKEKEERGIPEMEENYSLFNNNFKVKLTEFIYQFKKSNTKNNKLLLKELKTKLNSLYSETGTSINHVGGAKAENIAENITENIAENFVELLPLEIIIQIIKLLNPNNQLILRQVCQCFNNVVIDNLKLIQPLLGSQESHTPSLIGSPPVTLINLGDLLGKESIDIKKIIDNPGAMENIIIPVMRRARRIDLRTVSIRFSTPNPFHWLNLPELKSLQYNPDEARLIGANYDLYQNHMDDVLMFLREEQGALPEERLETIITTLPDYMPIQITSEYNLDFDEFLVSLATKIGKEKTKILLPFIVLQIIQNIKTMYLNYHQALKGQHRWWAKRELPELIPFNSHTCLFIREIRYIRDIHYNSFYVCSDNCPNLCEKNRACVNAHFNRRGLYHS